MNYYFNTDILTPEGEVFAKIMGGNATESLKFAKTNLAWFQVEDKYKSYTIGNTYKVEY